MTSRTAFASAPPAQAVEIKGLTKFYGGNGQSRPALDHIDLTIPRGVIFGLLGPKSAGKSALGAVLAAVAAAGLAIGDVSSEETDLDDIFLRLTRSGTAL